MKAIFKFIVGGIILIALTSVLKEYAPWAWNVLVVIGACSIAWDFWKWFNKKLGTET